MKTSYKDKTTELRRLRMEKGMSLNEFAKILNISIYTARKYESGWRVPSDMIKQKIAVFYGKTVDELFY